MTLPLPPQGLPSIAILVALLALLVGVADAIAQERSELRIRTDGEQVYTFMVEIADTPAERSRGLMGREELGARQGMLFDFKSPRPVSFWMRNTLIPLDMIFIDEDGRIIRIHHRAQPHDETPIPSGGPVLGVLEVPGGTARRLGIEAGDTVLHEIFNRS
jgi:uncharacterized membrane protein (UPF0127 family)